MPTRIQRRMQKRRINMTSENLRELVNRAAAFIAKHQLHSGAIPYYQDGPTDPWDHVECAIALDLSGKFDQSVRAYHWLNKTQNPDGSWWYTYRDTQPQEMAKDTNHSAYVATGVWQHYLATKDMNFIKQMWPMVESGVNFALSLQQPGGEIYWACDDTGLAWVSALLGGSSCIYQSIQNSLKLARTLGFDKPQWTAASQGLARAIREEPHRFDIVGENKRGYAMNWYYPVLSGIITGNKAKQHIQARWQEFIVDGWGCLCSLDRPWVTVAETCELILALVRIGELEKARTLLDWTLRLQDSDSGFWTGIAVPEEIIYPPGEKTTWTSAAVIVAAVASLEGKDIAIINL